MKASEPVIALDYLVKLQCQGDNKLHQFKQTWLEILNRMRQEDIASEKALHDCLYNKIKDSPAMKWELGLRYENLSYDDPKRSYGNFLNIIDRTSMRRREQSNLTQTQVGLRQMLEGKDLLAAPAKTAIPAPKGKPDKGNGKPDDAAAVLPQSKVKSTDSRADESKKHIRCKFHFTDAGVRSVIPRRLRRRRLAPEHQVHPVARTTKCVLPSERQERVHGRTAHSSMKQRQQPQQRRQIRKRSRLNPALR